MPAPFRWLSELPVRLRRVTSSGSYVPKIDGLRFLAIFIVILYHSGSRALKYYQPQGEIEQAVVAYQPLGQAGVELFFFISGLIISYPFLAGKGPKLGQFYKRRLLRLEPPYIIALTLCFLALGVVGLRPDAAPTFEQQEVPLLQAYLASLVYQYGNLYGAAPRLNPPLWSLEIEVVFYLLAPFVIFLYLKVKGLTGRSVLIGAFILFSVFLHASLVTSDYRWYYSFPTHMYAFFVGILVSDWTARTPSFYAERSARYDLVWALGFILIMVSASLQHLGTDAVTYAGILLMRVASIVCLFLGAAWGPWARGLMGAPWITLIGGACYSIYLIHIPVMNVVASLLFRVVHPTSLVGAWSLALSVLMLVSIVAGLIYYALVERPCMQRDWPQQLWSRLTGRRPLSAETAT